MSRCFAFAIAALFAAPAAGSPEDAGLLPITPPVLTKSSAREDVAIADAWRSRDFAAVIELASRRLAAVPSDGLARMLRGAAYYNSHDYPAAIADETVVVEGAPRAVMAFEVRGGAYVQRGDYGRAIIDENQAISLRPTAASYGYRADAKDRSGDQRGAIADLTAAIAMSRGDEWALALRGAIENYLYDNQNALVDENAALELNPKDGFALSTRAAVEYNLHDYQGAIRDDRSAIAAGFADFETESTLGDGLYQIGRYAQARQAYDASLKIKADLAVMIKRELARLRSQ